MADRPALSLVNTAQVVKMVPLKLADNHQSASREEEENMGCLHDFQTDFRDLRTGFPKRSVDRVPMPEAEL